MFRLRKISKKETNKYDQGYILFMVKAGSGKTHLIRSLANINTINNEYFKVIDLNIPESLQVVFQNPENQILAHKLSFELSFGLESSIRDTILLQSKLKKLKSTLTFIKNWERHPSTLSGGEMEMLNLVTAI